jgi:hypothetical protein
VVDITPAQLSLELNVSQKHIRDVLRDVHGTLPEGTTRWLLSESQADMVRRRFAGYEQVGGLAWTLEIGDTVQRRELHRAFGGQEQGGIVTPRSIPDIIAFTDMRSGAAFGYDTFEGLQPDGSYWYTGEGQQGDQVFERGNKALRDANRNGRPIRLFAKNGVNATYIGQFATGEPTYRVETIADVNNNPRVGIIFNFVPVDADLSAMIDGDVRTRVQATVALWSPPDASDVVVLPQEEPALPGDRVVSRIEFELQGRFGTWAAERGTPPRRLRLDVAATTIEPDLYVEEEGWVVEAKKSTGRAYVRTAIGQVLDYVHNARAAGVERAVPVVLLPGRPAADLMDLMLGLGIAVAIPDGDGFQMESPPA